MTDNALGIELAWKTLTGGDGLLGAIATGPAVQLADPEFGRWRFVLCWPEECDAAMGERIIGRLAIEHGCQIEAIDTASQGFCRVLVNLSNTGWIHAGSFEAVLNQIIADAKAEFRC